MKKESENSLKRRSPARSHPSLVRQKCRRLARWCCFLFVVMLFVEGLTSVACIAASNPREVRVGSELDFPPYALVDKNGQPTGFSIELIKAVTNAMGLSITITTGSWDTVWNALVAGQLDVLPIVAKLPERESLVDFGLPHTETYDAFFVRQGDPALPNIAAARGKEIVVMRSDAAHQELLERKFEGRLTLVDTIPEGLKQISSGKHDAFLCSKLIGTLSIKEHGITGLAAGPTIPDYKRVFSFAVKKGDKELLEKLNQGLLIVKMNGEYDRIYDRWLSFDDPWRTVQKYLVPSIIAVIAIAMMAGFWLVMLRRLVNKRTRELAETNETLRHARDDLEARVQERTMELAQSNQLLRTEITDRKHAEEALSSSERKYRNIFENATEGIFQSTQDGRYISVNPAFARIGGYHSPDEMMATVTDIQKQMYFHPEDRARLVELLNKQDKVENFEAEIRRKDNTIIWISMNVKAIRDQDGKTILLEGTIEDITERKRMEQTLQVSEQLYKSIVGSVKLGITLIDKNHKIIMTNKYFAELFNKPEAYFVGKYCFMESEKREAICPHCPGMLSMASREPAEVETEGILDDGSRFNALIRTVPTFASDGTVSGFIEVVEDITERKKVEFALKESEELFRNYLENAPDGIYMSDLEGNFLYGNRKCEQIIGYQREELIGKNFLELNLLPEESLNKAVQLLQANMEGKSTGPDEIDLISKEGHLIPVEINTNVVLRMGQRIVLSFVRDITERKLATERLSRSERDLRVLIGKNVDGLIIVDSDGVLRFMNPAAESLFGRKAENLIGTSMGLPLVSGEATEMEVFGKDKVQRTVEMRAADITWEEEKGFLVSLRDITERKQAEDNLRKSLMSSVQAIASIVELKDPYTAGHQKRVSTLAAAIAQEMGLAPEQCEGIRIAGMIHDIGKVAVPTGILNKPGKISDLEFALIQEHAEAGYNILKELDFPWAVDQMVFQHHERLDGSGYPRGLSGTEILIEAKIISVADVVEAMATDRPYRPAMGLDQALAEIAKHRGTFYDPEVVDVCRTIFQEKGFTFDAR